MAQPREATGRIAQRSGRHSSTVSRFLDAADIASQFKNAVICCGRTKEVQPK